MLKKLSKKDPALYEAMMKEHARQNSHIELIASENFTSETVMEAQGSILTNKYAEGYPNKRYYGGCEFVDIVEDLARDRAKELFGAKFANVQPHSGSQANMAVYFALVQPGDTLLGMNLTDGGHLTHGSPVNFSGKLYDIIPYGVDEKGYIDYEALEKIAIKEQPKMIIAGASAYPRVIHFDKMRAIADKVGAYLMVDMAHIAGLVAAGVHPSPMEYADVVTTTTHKTLRGPRGGMILTNNEEIAKKVNKAIFPGMQGGPLMHVIAAKATCFEEALHDEFKVYQQQVVKNAKALEVALKELGFNFVSDGTDNHLLLIDLRNKDITGKDCEKLLDQVGITTNKNTIPNEELSPFVTSGIRIGTPAITSRGFKEEDMKTLASIISRTIDQRDNELSGLRQEVIELCDKYPLYPNL